MLGISCRGAARRDCLLTTTPTPQDISQGFELQVCKWAFPGPKPGVEPEEGMRVQAWLPMPPINNYYIWDMWDIMALGVKRLMLEGLRPEGWEFETA